MTTVDEWGRLARELGWSIDTEISVLVGLARSGDAATSLRGLRAIRRVLDQLVDPAVHEMLAERIVAEGAPHRYGGP